VPLLGPTGEEFPCGCTHRFLEEFFYSEEAEAEHSSHPCCTESVTKPRASLSASKTGSASRELCLVTLADELRP